MRIRRYILPWPLSYFEDGDRDFAFYRNPGADMMLNEDQIDEEYIASARAFHYGTLSMTHEGVRNATRKAIDVAKKAGLLISFDPNLRPPLWKTMEEAKEQISYGLSQCDLLKISEEELEFMTGTKDIKEGAHILLEKYPNLKLMNVTMGKEGSMAFHEGKEVFQGTFYPGKNHRNHRSGRYFRRLCPELCAGAWDPGADRGKSSGNAPVCQWSFFYRDHQKRCPAGNA